MVDMGDDGKISDVLAVHGSSLAFRSGHLGSAAPSVRTAGVGVNTDYIWLVILKPAVGRWIPIALQTIRIQHCGIAAFGCASLAVNCAMKRMLSRLCIALLTTTAEA